MKISFHYTGFVKALEKEKYNRVDVLELGHLQKNYVLKLQQQLNQQKEESANRLFVPMS
ncbi:hypothetical protein [Lacibacter luteus]|uniref:hypothetical protein n=1 Tax=Lacibacter luteus TaxID=2508719 RepID=UPI0013E97953|nr:hypothetical protein [Lacibacter luteus]